MVAARLAVVATVSVLIGGLWHHVVAEPAESPVSDCRSASAKEVSQGRTPGSESLAAMTTEALVVELMGQTLGPILSSDRSDGGLSGFAKNHGGVRELLARPDAGSSLLRAYRDLCSTVSDPPGDTPAERGGFALKFTVVEMLLSAPEVVRGFGTREEQVSVLSALVKAGEGRARYDRKVKTPVYGEATLDVSALAASKYLEALQVPEFVKWREQHPDGGIKGRRGLSREEAKAILSMAERYLRDAAPREEGGGKARRG